MNCSSSKISIFSSCRWGITNLFMSEVHWILMMDGWMDRKAQLNSELLEVLSTWLRCWFCEHDTLSSLTDLSINPKRFRIDALLSLRTLICISSREKLPNHTYFNHASIRTLLGEETKIRLSLTILLKIKTEVTNKGDNLKQKFPVTRDKLLKYKIVTGTADHHRHHREALRYSTFQQDNQHTYPYPHS